MIHQVVNQSKARFGPESLRSGSLLNERKWCMMMYVLSGWWYTYPSDKYESQLEWLFPKYGKIQNVPNHHLDVVGLNGLTWVQQCQKPPIWKWFIKPIWGMVYFCVTHNTTFPASSILSKDRFEGKSTGNQMRAFLKKNAWTDPLILDVPYSTEV